MKITNQIKNETPAKLVAATPASPENFNRAATIAARVKRRGVASTLAGLLALAGLLGLPLYSHATTLVVTNLADSGPGTLRAAIAIANTNAGDTITFANTLSGQTIHLTSGRLTISHNLGIDASRQAGGVIIDAGGTNRVLEITNANVTLDALTLTNGYTTGDGGGILVESNAMLTLNDCTLSGNSAFGAFGGGGILNDGALMVNGSTFSGNSATNSYGGGIDNESSGAVAVVNSTFSGNSAGGGGGIENDYGTLTVSNCLFAGNDAVDIGYGGGIANYATLILNDCILSSNSAFGGGSGGGIENGAIYGTVIVNDCILSGNSASGGGTGGGIDNEVLGRTLAGTNGGILILNSTLSDNSATGSGSFGGGICNNGPLTVNDCILSNNSASGSGSVGGGILNEDEITMNNSTLVGNSASDQGGGIDNESSTTLAVTNSTLSGNSATNGGGGIYCYSATNTLDNCTLSDNSATKDGGGIENVNGGTVALNNCTLSGNSAPNGYGGGIESYQATNTLNNCTLAGNSASVNGGGIYGEGGSMTLNNCTFSLNSANNRGGGIYNAATLSFTNTIVAGNNASLSPNFYNSGSYSSLDNFLVGDPKLAPLGNYGGPTQTMPPLAGSPVIDAGDDSVTNFLTTDQRGYPRRFGSHVDIGAVELQSVPGSLTVVTTNSDNVNGFDVGGVSLREAVLYATNNATITFANTLSGQTILLTNGDIVLDTNLTIDASALPDGIQLNGNGASRIFYVSAGATNVLTALTITNGNAGGSPGGGIDNAGSLTLNECTVASNVTTSVGGGIANYGALIVNESTFAGNVSDSLTESGGGIDNSGTLTVNESTFTRNSANGGGALYAESGSLLTVNQSTICSNLAFCCGGGISVYATTGGTLVNSIVAGNSAGNPSIADLYGSFTTYSNDLTGVNPMLAPLGNYGGPTETMPPQPGSPAIDMGGDYATNTFATDQRGLPRLSGAHVDIGAVEAQFVAANPNNPPVLENPVWSSAGGTNVFQYAFTNVSGADFTALTSTNLALPLADWTVLGNIPEISSGQYRFTGLAPTNDPQRFYRVVSP